MEEQALAALGRKQLELEQLNRNYDQLLALLGNVAAGEIDPSRVTVNREARTWAVTEAVLRPELAAALKEQPNGEK